MDFLTRAERLPEHLLELTDTLGPDFDAAGLLYGLALASTELLDIDAAGVLLLDEQGQLITVAATDNSTDHLEHLQAATHRGPCLESIRDGRGVSVLDLDHDQERWPEFARQARDEGFRSVHALPLSLRGDVVGGLNLFRRATGALSDADQRIAGLLAAAAATGLLHRRAVHHLETVNDQLQHALTSRIVIEQAKGFLAARLGTDPEVAFNLIRSYARRRSQPLTQVAQAVTDSRIDLT